VALTLFYWVADHRNSPEGLRITNPLQHGGTAALLLMDIAASRAPLVSDHIQA
jgi:hypothetical protein